MQLNSQYKSTLKGEPNPNQYRCRWSQPDCRQVWAQKDISQLDQLIHHKKNVARVSHPTFWRGLFFLSLRLSLSLFLCLGFHLLYGQASLSIERTQALIGDQLVLTLQINTPSGTEWVNADVMPADTVAAVEVASIGEVQQTTTGSYTQFLKTWTIAVFDTGLIRVPAMPVILQSSLGMDTQYTNDIPLLIAGVTDSLGLAPIKPIQREPAKLSDYLAYIVVAIVLCVLAIFAVMYRRRKPKQKNVIEIRDEKPAHVLALEQLDALEREKLWQQGLIKEYHSRMNYIMRTYLERRYRIPALESTSGEIMSHLRQINLSEDLEKQIQEVMTVEDLIKFAKAEPPVDIHAQYLQFARSLILQTKIDAQIPVANE
ncbi:MAG TPA: hypothetical protein VI603_13610 [Saprospiraceae bacterium]|nr:hypothetical protein [Saprospiraceae bacterium]